MPQNRKQGVLIAIQRQWASAFRPPAPTVQQPATVGAVDFVWAPELGRDNMVKITVEQAALLQGFPETCEISGRKTARYRQVGHATPPPVGEALGRAVAAALILDPAVPAAG